MAMKPDLVLEQKAVTGILMRTGFWPVQWNIWDENYECCREQLVAIVMGWANPIEL